ncbi:MAG: ribonuclease HII [Candidatus Omnitrophica bacterium]|nr:ribonuclease HII [Candidatus Omnitrophota bacterium]MDD5237399.1 ribonuclease HII [Candidatus Omnitrophota bacterium]
MSGCGVYYENKFKKNGCNFIIGVDEAGRGPLAGPVVAAAVSLKRNARFKSRIDDSKKLTHLQRESAYLEIVNKSLFGIGIVNEKIIDSLNILVATRIAMEEAIQSLLGKLKGQQRKQHIHILVDGNVKLEVDYPFTNIIKGDAKSKSIACGSILAKVTRDRIMSIYDKVYPQYRFFQHKGYPTKKHKLAIKKFGPSLIHRTSFNCV